MRCLRFTSFLLFSLVIAVSKPVTGQKLRFSGKDPGDLQGLKGLWKMEKGEKTIYESWKKGAGDVLIGTSYQMAAGSRKDLETLRIFLKEYLTS